LVVARVDFRRYCSNVAKLNAVSSPDDKSIKKERSESDSPKGFEQEKMGLLDRLMKIMMGAGKTARKATPKGR
jgi:hypothetical protein